MSRVSLRGFALLGVLITLIQSFLRLNTDGGDGGFLNPWMWAGPMPAGSLISCPRNESIRISKEALASGFVNARLYANLGRALHLEGGCLEESEQFLRRSLDLNPDNPWGWSWLGLVRADQGHLEEAETHARTALVEHDQHAVLIHNLALVLVHHPDERADKIEEALHCCEQAEKLADFPFPHPTQLAVELRQRLQSFGTRPNPST